MLSSSFNSDDLSLLALKATIMSDPTRVLGIWSEYDLVLCQWVGISCSFTSQVGFPSLSDHERVRSDIEGNLAPKSSVQPPKGSLSTTQGEGKRVATAANPNAEDAAELLRMCMRCGIPKTYSSERGMVCPQCGDRPLADANKETDKKKGSTIKEKEKNKRMKGQSSHASWKSETEMQLRQ
ncbi:unnamed protein product, partial [Vitis vinifera]